jgi:hypothetical protein
MALVAEFLDLVEAVVGEGVGGVGQGVGNHSMPVGGFPPTETFRPASSSSVPAGTLKRPGHKHE